MCLLVFNSCKTVKAISSATADASMTAKAVAQSHKEASPAFTTLASRIYVAYEDDKKSQGITVSLRMEKDKKIWVKASILGITLAKALITPERVSYYETIGNTYFEGDYALLSEWLRTDLDFEKAQAILLGQSIFELDNSYVANVQNNRYRLQPKVQPNNFIHSLFMDPQFFKVVSASVSQPKEGRLLSMKYGDYQRVEDQLFPSDIVIDTSEKDSKTKIEVTYRKIDLNVSVSFPFKIPSGYTKMEL